MPYKNSKRIKLITEFLTHIGAFTPFIKSMINDKNYLALNHNERLARFKSDDAIFISFNWSNSEKTYEYWNFIHEIYYKIIIKEMNLANDVQMKIHLIRINKKHPILYERTIHYLKMTKKDKLLPKIN